MEEVVWKLELQDDKAKQKAIGVVSGFSGVDTIILDSKEKKLMAIADIDHEHPSPMPTYYARVGADKGELGGCVIC